MNERNLSNIQGWGWRTLINPNLDIISIHKSDLGAISIKRNHFGMRLMKAS